MSVELSENFLLNITSRFITAVQSWLYLVTGQCQKALPDYRIMAYFKFDISSTIKARNKMPVIIRKSESLRVPRYMSFSAKS